jgi:hypothetical protein
MYVSSDTWPGAAGSLGRTRAEIAEANVKRIQPTHGAGFAYLEGLDGAIIEYSGNYRAERFNHVHLYQSDPYCAELWYQRHLGAQVSRATGPPSYTEETCKASRPERSWPALQRESMFRMPSSVAFDDIVLQWRIQPDDKSLVSSRGHLADHIGLSVKNLDAWIAKLRREHVKFSVHPIGLVTCGRSRSKALVAKSWSLSRFDRLFFDQLEIVNLMANRLIIQCH